MEEIVEEIKNLEKKHDESEYENELMKFYKIKIAIIQE